MPQFVAMPVTVAIMEVACKSLAFKKMPGKSRQLDDSKEPLGEGVSSILSGESRLRRHVKSVECLAKPLTSERAVLAPAMPRRHFTEMWLLLISLVSFSEARAQTAQFVPFASAQPVLSAMHDSLPPELKGSGQVTAAQWDKWVRTRDRDIRSRLTGGEEDTLTNLLRLGVTYTSQQRISFRDLESYGKDRGIDAIADKRADDLIRALAAPHPSEGMTEMRAFLQRQGFDLTTPKGQKKTKSYLLANLARERDEVLRWEAEVSRKNPNLYQAFQSRGISTDSDLYPDYIIEVHLRHLMEQGLLKPGSVHRVAIVGPGLDFVNKNAGADFYPPQTTQPFAVIDSLARLGLSDPNTVQLYTFDISSRVNRHIERARSIAAAGKPYTIQLLCTPSEQWEASYRVGFLDYWQKFGDQIGKPVARIAVPAAASEIWNRAVNVRPEVVKRITPVDMNIVYQTLPLPPEQRFDLVIGTNIFIYYGALEQSLARANLATMMKPGAFLITNEALPGTAPSKLADSLKTSVPFKVSDTEYVFGYVREK